MSAVEGFQRRIHLVRHGLTDWNRSRRFQGHTDVPLSPAGLQQAAAIAERLDGLPIVHCFASDLSRARDTASAIAGQLGIALTSDADLREANKGEFEGAYRDPESGLIGDETRSFDENDVAARPPGGESIIDVRDRCRAFVHRLDEADGSMPEGELVLVSHGGTMRALMTVLLDLPVEASRSFHFDNCGLTTVDLRGDQPSILLRYNDCQHLPVPAEASL